MVVSEAERLEQPLDARKLALIDSEVEVEMISRLFAKQRIDAPAAVNPDIDVAPLERLQHLYDIVRSHIPRVPGADFLKTRRLLGEDRSSDIRAPLGWGRSQPGSWQTASMLSVRVTSGWRVVPGSGHGPCGRIALGAHASRVKRLSGCGNSCGGQSLIGRARQTAIAKSTDPPPKGRTKLPL